MDKELDNRTQLRIEADKALAEFLASGKKITVISQGKRSEQAEVKAQWGKPRKKITSPYDNKD